MMTSNLPGQELLKIENLSLKLPTEKGWIQILEDVNFEIHKGEILGLAGESGSGKSLTALAIMNLLPRNAQVSGSIQFGGINLLELSTKDMRSVRGREIGMVFQEPMSSLHPSWTIGEQISEVIRTHEKVSRKAAWSRSVQMLALMDIPNPAERAKQYAFQFSGGMQQRVMMAIALSCNPKLLIADEPTTALDATIQAQIMEIIQSMQKEREMAILFITHDLGVLASLAQGILIMYAGQLVELANASVIFDDPLHPYTQGLILSAPHPGMKGGKLPSIKGDPPRLGRLPSGCRFHPRCEFALESCKVDAIPATQTPDGRTVRCIRSDELMLGKQIEVAVS